MLRYEVGSRETAHRYRKINEGEGATVFGHPEAEATCKGEWADSQTAPAGQKTETMSQESTPPDFSRNSGIPVCSLETD